MAAAEAPDLFKGVVVLNASHRGLHESKVNPALKPFHGSFQWLLIRHGIQIEEDQPDLRRTTKGVRLPRRAFKVAWRLLVKDRDDRVLPLQVLDARQVAHGSLQARLALRKEQEGVGAAPGAPRGWKNSTHHLVCNNLTYILDVAIQELGEDVVTELACFEYLARVVEAFLMVEKTSGWNNGAMHLLPLVEGSTIGSAAARAARKAARQEAELASAAAAAAKKDK
eukprot:jgi/Mesvir1/24602/Mv21919-RA.1